MRQLLIDTETTGLDPKQGHRIIELAAVELVNRRLTGRHLHYRIDPERDVDYGATEVHGMTREDLRGMPCFRDIAGEFADFARGSEWIIHNAPFDVAFFDTEFELCGMPPSAAVYGRLVDTLALARETFPGKRNNLDALCERFGVSNAHRTLHGALLDAQLLAEVYLALTSGQGEIGFGGEGTAEDNARAAVSAFASLPADIAARPRVRPREDELAAHAARLETIRKKAGRCVWETG